MIEITSETSMEHSNFPLNFIMVHLPMDNGCNQSYGKA